MAHRPAGTRYCPHMASNGALLSQRIASLSDSVFGVGMTLLAYDITFPKDAGVRDTFVSLRPHLYGLALSFGIAAMYWLNQQRRLGLRIETEGPPVAMELVLLLPVVLLPISTKNFLAASMDQGARLGTAYVFYAANLSLLACINAALWRLTPCLRDTADQRTRGAVARFMSTAVAILFLTSLALAVVWPRVASSLWWCAFLSPLGAPLYLGWQKRRGGVTS